MLRQITSLLILASVLCLGLSCNKVYKSAKCGAYAMFKPKHYEMYADTLITFDPVDYKTMVWTGKFHKTINSGETICSETYDNGNKRREFAKIDGKLYLITDVVLINKEDNNSKKKL